MRTAIIILGVLICSAATADPRPWMKKENSETLHALIFVDDDCPLSKTEAKEIVEGVLIRSRLRPGMFPMSLDTLGFLVAIECVKLNSDLYIYYIDTNFFLLAFGRILQEPFPDYGRLGQGG